MRATEILLAFALALASGAAPARAASPAADSATAPAVPSFGRRDGAFALVAAGAITVAATHDRSWLARSGASDSRLARSLAADARHLGEPVEMGAALLAADAFARIARREGAAAASERIAFACVAAGGAALLIKEAAGRQRPDESRSPSSFHPFSGHDALPSGHATVAFALAASLDAEARSPWLRVIVYPAAALTAWSRVHDRRHWPSDVVAGAAIGGWCAHHADRFAQRRWPRGLAFALLPQRNGVIARFGRSF